MEAQDRPGTDGVHREDAADAPPAIVPTGRSRDVLMAGVFLLQRLDELDWSDPDGLEREWNGHIEPAIARFRMAIANQPDSSAKAEVIRALAPEAGRGYLQYRSSIGDKGSRLDAWKAGVEWVISDPDFAI